MVQNSNVSEQVSAVERLRVVEIAPKPIQQPAIQAAIQPIPTPEPQIIIQKQSISEAMLAAFSALGFAVSARFLLFLAMFGAFALAVMAMLSRQTISLVVLGLWCAMTVLPLIWLEINSRRMKD
jgi:hypothetical protein